MRLREFLGGFRGIGEKMGNFGRLWETLGYLGYLRDTLEMRTDLGRLLET